MRKTIAVDIDDVLAANAEGFTAYSNKTWGHTLTSDDYTEEWAVVWGVSLEEAKRRTEAFHLAGVVGEYRHFPSALPVLRHLRKDFDLIVVTSRRSVLKPETDVWLERYFPGIFKAIHFAGIWDGEHHMAQALKQNKAGLCKELGAQYLIDDQLKHCVGAVECGMGALLFGDYRWNQLDKPLPAGITRTADWLAVQEYFDAAR